MANPNPRLQNLTPFKSKGDKPLSEKPISIRVEREDYEAIMSLPRSQRNDLLRQWIKNGLQEFNKSLVEESDPA